jgi:hypothetical protein
VGVEYKHYVIPAEAMRRPSAERIVRLVRTMEAEGWLLSPKSEAFRKMSKQANLPRAVKKTGACYEDESWDDWWDKGTALPYPLDPAWLRTKKRAIRLTWPFEQVFELGLRYPLTRPPYLREWVYFKYQLHWSRYLIGVAGGQCPRCACGQSLALEPQPVTRHALGPFLFAFRTKCPSCGAVFEARGSGLHRFGLVIDCGKNLPESGARCEVHPELLTLVEDVIGSRFIQFGE